MYVIRKSTCILVLIGYYNKCWQLSLNHKLFGSNSRSDFHKQSLDRFDVLAKQTKVEKENDRLYSSSPVVSIARCV
ncbi:hypothetical protein EB796_017539 [Bugula neritina]|uniref:Uncharacterized protein n=1 Tax=Bugula neritina TaxID=10212 RepID=A0A7J7JEU7_BUGNE|nr:hypothetical protein EB796_017539 [Bugula neritina]